MTDNARIVASPGREVAGSVRVPGDKSISHRALILGALAEGETLIRGFLSGEDCISTLKALRQLGATIDDSDPDCIRVQGVGLNGLRAPAGPLDLGNSGTGMRLLAGVLAGQAFESELTGDESLRSRPMERVATPLGRMGARIISSGGYPPLHIKGSALKPLYYESPVASAQVKSALLLAGLYADGTTRVEEPGITRDHTERMLQAFGVNVMIGDKAAEVSGPARLQATEIAVPGDFSSAAFALAAGCLSATGPVEITGVGINPTRTGFLEILKLMGAGIAITDVGTAGSEPVATLTVNSAVLKGAEIPPELVPLAIDELPLVFALAACAEGETRVTGAKELRHKESDRIAIMATGLSNLGIEVDERSDGLVVKGGRLRGGTVNSAGDHRVAMAFSVAAMTANDTIEILDTINVATSFPGFVPLMQSLGLQLAEG
ncbi:MAG: 3-phosphoshikimate 1-carboxyvinyltransferase [Gammaproteobacteria bacterium]|jgi:3-phosphoshikimate 1-carboxyvinyltransferase|nr:3-phosphoshikimate 1-carboxyvinyltransferase [Gammaproteobacteria bacterium]MDP6616361.1 3-phosphoshikimate 1-carboxyvinyltransferase [Gammaproteobacteria bacterium]MDP6695333.1 3-phosphoshikimate 1-carboxyvinyltransferase [Gammaproteobacteria bacterium]